MARYDDKIEKAYAKACELERKAQEKEESCGCGLGSSIVRGVGSAATGALITALTGIPFST